jgi:predicted dehydrogenase
VPALGPQEDLYANPQHRPLKRPVTVLIIDAGRRGTAYAHFAARYSVEMRVVAVAGPNAHRRQRFARLHRIALEDCFDDWDSALGIERLADAVIIAKPGTPRSGPCLRALDLG